MMDFPANEHPDNVRNLLSRPGGDLLDAIRLALAATAKTVPIPQAHRADLPFAVRDLSRLLTAERGAISHPYWSAPRYLTAYLRYFLPWNLYRLGWLLPSLALPLRPGATLLDLGSGPLTLPLALWCCRPDLRSVPLTFICSDVAIKPMETGRSIFRNLAGADSPWSIRLLRAPLEKALFAAASASGNGLDAILAGNVLNELPPPRNMLLEDRIEELMGLIFRKLAPGGRALLLEPGTRLGGKMIALSRKGALRRGFLPLAPCPHNGPCPMLEQPLHYAPSPPFTGWCHFIHPADSAPSELLELGRRAHLEKDSLALSCLLLLRPPAGQENENSAPTGLLDDSDDLEALYNEIMSEDSAALDGPPPSLQHREELNPEQKRAAPSGTIGPYAVLRVISDLIRLPGENEPARYACCEKGLALLCDAVRVPSGGSVTVRWDAAEPRDLKTGALLLRRAPRATPEMRPRAQDRSETTAMAKGTRKTGEAGGEHRPKRPQSGGAARAGKPTKSGGSPRVGAGKEKKR